jgi:hypothetical protein
MTAKFIVSSVQLRRMLVALDLDLWDSDHEVTFILGNGYLQPDGYKKKIPVECKTEGMFTVRGDRLERLAKICGLLEEQPLVLYYDHNRWLNIQNAVV